MYSLSVNYQFLDYLLFFCNSKTTSFPEKYRYRNDKKELCQYRFISLSKRTGTNTVTNTGSNRNYARTSLPVTLQQQNVTLHYRLDRQKRKCSPWLILEVICGVKSLASFYELRLLKGEMVLDDDNSNDVMINEAAAKLFDWQDPIGKSINSFKIKGLIKDTYNASPTTPPNPTLYISPEKSKTQYYFSPQSILFKYKEGSWNSIKKKLEEINQEKKKEDVHITIHNAMEEYEKYLQSEKTLLKMLYFTTAVCIMISLFGIFSLVTLTCEQRKKEIAIRKVNGATIGSILKIFFYEYLLLIVVSAAIAFPIGYLAMRHWLESYVKQTEINSWIYPLLFISVGLVIAACISGKIWITAKRNPAEIIRSE